MLRTQLQVFLFQGVFLKPKTLDYMNIYRANLTFVQNKIYKIYIKKSSPVTFLEWPRGFQEVKVPTFLDNGTV
jgi:hypothetical protein